jgi:precorrin-3B synthase
MATGDGLLVRLTPTGATIPCKTATALCAAAREHGNGIIEVTSRGNIQVRGLTEDSVPAFAAALGDIGAYFGEGPPVTCDPLAGLDADELFATHAFAACLRDRIDGLFHRLSPKVSVVVDGGGALHLDAVSADVRLRAIAIDGARVHIAVGGDARTATPIGIVAPEDTVDAVLGVLATIAGRGPAVRARDIIATEGADVFRRAVVNLVSDGRGPSLRGPVDPVGIHSLRDGTVAVGFALAFGHTDADTLSRLADAAADAGASGLRTAPDRALLVIGVASDAVPRLQATAEHLGLIVHRDDPRRRVVACAGAPICTSAEIPSRVLAPMLADIAAHMEGAAPVLHVSGCAKGCACPRAVPLTVVGIDGRCGVIVNGSARDRPQMIVSQDELPDALTRLANSARTVRAEAHVD